MCLAACPSAECLINPRSERRNARCIDENSRVSIDGQGPDELGVRWWLSAKILFAVFMAGLYSFSFHSRRLGLLRGQKLAYVMVIGFGAMLAIYLLLSVTNLKDAGFWSSAV